MGACWRRSAVEYRNEWAYYGDSDGARQDATYTKRMQGTNNPQEMNYSQQAQYYNNHNQQTNNAFR